MIQLALLRPAADRAGSFIPGVVSRNRSTRFLCNHVTKTQLNAQTERGLLFFRVVGKKAVFQLQKSDVTEPGLFGPFPGGWKIDW
jgi:hypothetical protein